MISLDQVRTTARIRWAALLAAAVVVALGCGDGPTAPRVEHAPTPTPIPTPRISGSWNGEFKGLCLFDPADHGVRATLDQQGAAVSGAISDGWAGQCSLAGHFEGTLSGTHLTGKIDQTITVDATATETQMSWKVQTSKGFGTIAFNR